MVGEDDRRAVERREILASFHDDAVAKPEEQTGDRPEETVEQEFHG
jgi:hypothetical protein